MRRENYDLLDTRDAVKFVVGAEDDLAFMERCADEAGLFKVRPEVYQLAVDHLGVARERLLFVSSNGWDVAGAKAFGFTVGWLNRRGLPPEELGVRADYEASNLLELAEMVVSA